MTDRTKLDAYITELEAAAYQRGYETARREYEGKVRSIEETLLNMYNGLQKTISDFSKLPSLPADEFQPVLITTEEREPRKGSDLAKVLEAIREFPGLRGIELVRLLSDIEERTVRTALHRLKARNVIFQQEGAWFPVPATALERTEGQPP